MTSLEPPPRRGLTHRRREQLRMRLIEEIGAGTTVPTTSRRLMAVLVPVVAAAAVAAIVVGMLYSVGRHEVSLPAAGATTPASVGAAAPARTTAATTASTTTPSASSEPRSAPTSPEPITSDVSGQVVGFYSPSGNVACLIVGDPPESATVRCEISQHTWTAPPQPSTCQLDWGSYFWLDSTARFACVGDTIRGARPVNPASPPGWYHPGVDGFVAVDGAEGIGLGYGRTLISGPLSCSSTVQGMACANTRTGASLFLSRDSYTLR